MVHSITLVTSGDRIILPHVDALPHLPLNVLRPASITSKILENPVSGGLKIPQLTVLVITKIWLHAKY